MIPSASMWKALRKLGETALRYGTSTGPNVMYFETGQGPENAGNMHYGADMATLEARTYGFGSTLLHLS